MVPHWHLIIHHFFFHVCHFFRQATVYCSVSMFMISLYLNTFPLAFQFQYRRCFFFPFFLRLLCVWMDGGMDGWRKVDALEWFCFEQYDVWSESSLVFCRSDAILRVHRILKWKAVYVYSFSRNFTFFPICPYLMWVTEGHCCCPLDCWLLYLISKSCVCEVTHECENSWKKKV